jgi:hypothetical protein
LLFFLILFLSICFSCKENLGEIQTSQQLISFINSSISAEEQENIKFIIIFFFDPADFECPPCYFSLIKTIDTLKDNHSRNSIIRGFMLNQLSFYNDIDRFNKWKVVNSINFEIDFISFEEWVSLELKKSSILVLSREKKILFYDIFPVGDEKFKELLNLISL